MKLAGDPLAQFVHHDPSAGVNGTTVHVDSLAEANGVRFTCPKCENGHQISVWFEGVPLKQHLVGPGRWKVVGGKGLADLSLAPSIQCGEGCNWHGYVRNGETINA